MGDVTDTTVPIFRSREDSPALQGGVGDVRFLVRSAEVNSAYAMIEQVVPPASGPPLHVHRRETEIFYVVDGQFEFHVGGRTVVATAGGSAICPRDIPHRFRNVSDQPARLLIALIPGQFGEYFERVGRLDPEDHDANRRLAAEYGVEVLE